MARLGISVSRFDPLIGDDIAQLVRPETRVVFLESPGSLTMEVHDIPTIVAAVRRVQPDAVIMLDNTWAAGILLPALKLGVDISIQAATKYLIGHSDAMIGTAVANARVWETLRENVYLMGQMVDADTAYVTSRGLRTLAVRLPPASRKQSDHCTVAGGASRGRAGQSSGVTGKPGHALWKRDFSGSSGLFSFVLHARLSNPTVKPISLITFAILGWPIRGGDMKSLILAIQPEELGGHASWRALYRYPGPFTYWFRKC